MMTTAAKLPTTTPAIAPVLAVIEEPLLLKAVDAGDVDAAAFVVLAVVKTGVMALDDADGVGVAVGVAKK
ncbi:hypothetical protein N7504_012079 [Penicillium tannophilum]|nr:hypothetical protein N7504_012079 [Penicillium tannophilum]